MTPRRLVPQTLLMPSPSPRQPRTFGYARVSTEDQTSAAQVAVLQKAGVDELFTDEGVSGRIPAAERPEFALLLEILQPGDTVVFYALSRLGRSMLDVVGTLQALDARGIFVKSMTESFDTSTPTGRAMVGMIAVFSQLEREMIVDRIKSGVAAAQARGVKFGRKKHDRTQALALLEAGQSAEAVAASTGLSVSTVRRAARGR